MNAQPISSPLNSVGVPPWLGALGVKRGGFYTTSKARTQRMMREGITSEARQVYACLELATMGFQQELAVIREKDRTITLRSEHLCQQTGLSKQHVRRAIVELETAGLAERRSVDGKPLGQGNIAIYSWAVPREGQTDRDSAREPRAATFFANLSPHYSPLDSFAKTHKINPPEAISDESLVAARGYLDEALEAVAQAEIAKQVAIAKLKTAFAQATANKEERNIEKQESRYVGKDAEPTDQPTPVPPPEPEPIENDPADPSSVEERILQLPAVQAVGLKLHSVPTPKLLREITQALQGAPLERLDVRIRQRFRSVKSFGLVLNLAEDVGAAFREEPKVESTAAANGELDKILLDPDYLTIPEADFYVGLSGDTLFELIESGRLPAIDVGPRPGGKYRILRSDLDAFAKERLKE